MFDFKQTEEKILKFWDEHDVFRKSMEQRRGAKPFVFFEGPPTANGSPGIHHVIARVFKDIFNRYQTMRGRYILRRGGWDTHGLPVEIGVEKTLGFKSKKDIEAYGIAAYNRKCRESVWKYKDEWDQFTRRIGYWVDLDDPYITYENSYMESLWAVIHKFWENKLFYQAHRVVPFCTRCGTPLSSHEVNQGYQTVTDNSVYLKFRVKKSKLKLPANTYIMAWTTTPWTLPGNVALAVGKDIHYVLAKKNGNDEYFIIAADLVNQVLGAPLAIETEFTGKDLVGISYEPLFKIKALAKPKSYKVYAADFVSTGDGTGVVHTAVMYGEDDYRLGMQFGLPAIHTVTEQGTFIGVSRELDGKYVKDSTTEKLILDSLRERGLLFAEVPYSHEYPFCWRCDTPLLYYAKDSWFVRMSALNKEILVNNDLINWVPEHLKNGRFGQWLREGKDWAFSRERYWGTPLPIWSARNKRGQLAGQPLFISSLADLDKYRADKPAQFWAMRHGEADKNVSQVIDQGQMKSPLTKRGRDQVITSANDLKKLLARKRVRLAAIVASPVQRTRETAELVAKVLGIKDIIFDERLGEIKFGPTLMGHPDSEYHKAYPTYESKFSQRPPDGESLTDLRERSWAVLKELNEKYAGRHVLLISHEYPIWMLQDVASGWEMKQSIVEKEKRGKDFLAYAQVESLVVRNLPRDEKGNLDMHRPYIDDITLKRPGSRVELRRVPEIADVWFDSGAMPYAQWHWPFENKDVFAEQFPADFISEAVDQTRGWFYTLLAVSTALGLGTSYRTVISLGHVLDEKGQKMSKSKGNVVLPEDVFNAVGVDAIRWYFYTVNNPGDAKLFNIKDVRERMTGFMMTLENCLRFFELYRQGQSDGRVHEFVDATHMLDKWVISRLNGLVGTVTKCLDRYDLTTAARAIEQFVIEDFSQWWLRRSRKRNKALVLLGHILRQVSLLCAPFIPFMAEDMWSRLDGDKESVHLADWPKALPELIDPKLEEQMVRVREFITAGLAIRKDQNIKVRQPLASVTVPADQSMHGDLETLILEELNVKKIIYDVSTAVQLDMHIGSELRAEGFAREVMRAIQDMRKEAGLQVGDKAYCQWHTEDDDIAQALMAHAEMIMRDTGLLAFVRQSDDKTLTIERTFELIPSKSLWLGIRK